MYMLLMILGHLNLISGTIRDYYIAAVDLDWDYAPQGQNMVTEDTTFSDKFIKNGQNRIGSSYTKIVYRQYSDGTFTDRIPSPEWMGILGPMMRAEVGDELHVHFKNLAYASTRPFSVHAHGVLYTKNSEGAIYLDKTAGTDKKDDGVLPGEEYTYIWKVTPEFGPTMDDPKCIPWGYHSHVHADKDIDSGLVGLLVTCQKGTLYADGTRRDYTKEYIIYMDIADENNSWMIKSNSNKCGDPNLCLYQPDAGFAASNLMGHVNGYVYGNLPGLEVTVGQTVIWYIMSLNSGIHSISFSGNTLVHRNHRVDTVPFLPSTFTSAEMMPAFEGSWLLYSRVAENFEGGMSAFYTVHPEPIPMKKRQADIITDVRSLLNTGSKTKSLNTANTLHSRMFQHPWYSGYYPTNWGYGYPVPPAPWYSQPVPSWYWGQNPYGWGLGGFGAPSPWNPYPWWFGPWRNAPHKDQIKTTIPPTKPPTTKPQPAITTAEDKEPAGSAEQTNSAEVDPTTTEDTTTLSTLTTVDPNYLTNAWKRPGIPVVTLPLDIDTNLNPESTLSQTFPPPTTSNPYNPWYPFKVKLQSSRSRRFSGMPIFGDMQPSVVKRYYLAIEKEKWNYVPSGKDQFNGGAILDNIHAKPYFEQGPTRIGSEYIKARYVEYTDDSFTNRVVRSREEAHLGLLGPPLTAEIGNELVVVLKNNADRPYSFLPHGVVFQKNQEGFLYKDVKNGNLRGKIANPGEVVTYTFYVPELNAGPTSTDAPCVTHTYQSAVDPVKDLNTGLFGPIVICKQGQTNHVFNWILPEKTTSWFFANRHVYLALLTVNENLSWYIDENIQTYTTSPYLVDKTDPLFIESNAMHAINGRVFANLDPIEMCLEDNVIWHLMDFGGTTDMHGLYIHGQTWEEFGNNIDSKGLLPGYSSTMTSTPDTVGTWALVCRTNSHFEIGMVAEYTVKQCNKPIRTFKETQTRTYFIGATEVEWDYAPLKRSLLDGEELLDMNQPGGVFVVGNDMFIGSKYKKAVYRRYTDNTFTTQVPRGPGEEHLGVMGPFIKAEIGEIVNVVFKNMASKPLSIHPQGLQYSKDMEGAKYKDGTGHAINGNSVAPGRTFKYHWTVPERAGPGLNDPNCIGRMYYSSVDSVKDIYTGLFGPLVICRAGILDENGHRLDVNKEFAVMFMVLDENKSFYIHQNIQKYAPLHLNAIKAGVQDALSDLHAIHHMNNMSHSQDTNVKIAVGTGENIQPVEGSVIDDTHVAMNSHSFIREAEADLMVSHSVHIRKKREIDFRAYSRNQKTTANKVPIIDLFVAAAPERYNTIWSYLISQNIQISSKKGQLKRNKRDALKTGTVVPGKSARATGHSSSAAIKKRDTVETIPALNNNDIHKSILNHDDANMLNEGTHSLNHIDLNMPIINSTNHSDMNMTIMNMHPIIQHAGDGEMMFEHSNHMNSINGRLMGNLNGITMNQGDTVAWYIMGLGSAEDYHPVHIHGQIFTRHSDKAHRSDVIEVFPSTSDTVEMLAVNPGSWILHCHFSKHAKNGMQLIYTVNPKP